MNFHYIKSLLDLEAQTVMLQYTPLSLFYCVNSYFSNMLAYGLCIISSEFKERIKM